jgi:uncharacterized surface anchored protein
MDSVSGKGIADAEIILTPPIGDYIVHTTDANGSFEFTGLRAGDYHIKLHRPGYSEVTLPASVTAGQSVVLELRSKAESGGVILRVVDPDGKGVAGASVTLQAGTGTTPLKTAATGSEGNLVQQLDPGTYSVSVTAPGYAPGSATITVGAGQLQNVTITLQKAP